MSIQHDKKRDLSNDNMNTTNVGFQKKKLNFDSSSEINNLRLRK